MSGTLQVDSITNSAGTGAPSFPHGISGISARITGFSSPATFSTPTKIIFSTVNYDTNSAYNNVTGIYTVPVTGKYFIAACIRGSNNTTNSLDNLYIYINGSLVSIQSDLASLGGGTYSLQVSDQLNLTAGDQISIFGESGNTFTLDTTSATLFRLFINFIGS